MVWSAVYYTIVTAILGTIISLAIGCAFAYLTKSQMHRQRFAFQPAGDALKQGMHGPFQDFRSL